MMAGDNYDTNGNYDNGVDYVDVDGLMMLMFLMIHDRAGSCIMMLNILRILKILMILMMVLISRSLRYLWEVRRGQESIKQELESHLGFTNW